MFDIDLNEDGRIRLAGRLDSAQCDKARQFFDTVDSPCIIDCTGLEFISSAGLGVLLVVQKQATRAGGAITLINVNGNIRDVLRHTGLDTIFRIEGG